MQNIDTTYNGWTNRETWLVNLHYNPETIEDIDYIKETLEDKVEELDFFLKDYINLDLINWQELKDYLR